MPFDGLPLVMAWELTLACNLRCRHCGSSAGHPRTGELTLSECLSICDQFPALLVQEVDFTGGEPLLRPDWPQIAARLVDLGIRVQILSNGLALDDATVDRMRDVGVAAVGVSIDGLETTHDHVRGYPGLFRQAMAGIRRVQDAEISLSVITTINGLNLPELPALAERLWTAGISRWQVQPIFPVGRSQETPTLQLTEAQYLDLKTFAQQWLPEAKEHGLSLELADSFGYYGGFDTHKPAWKGCPAGLVACGITSDGKVKGCLSLPDGLIEGDLRKDDLWDIWFRPEAFPYTRRFSVEGIGPACATCDKAQECKGGCSAMSYGSTGRFHNDPYCFYGIWQRSAQLTPAK